MRDDLWWKMPRGNIADTANTWLDRGGGWAAGVEVVEVVRKLLYSVRSAGKT